MSEPDRMKLHSAEVRDKAYGLGCGEYNLPAHKDRCMPFNAQSDIAEIIRRLVVLDVRVNQLSAVLNELTRPKAHEPDWI